jgi:hypothetical protein
MGLEARLSLKQTQKPLMPAMLRWAIRREPLDNPPPEEVSLAEVWPLDTPMRAPTSPSEHLQRQSLPTLATALVQITRRTVRNYRC